MKHCLLIIGLLISFCSSAQTNVPRHLGGKIGLYLQFGTHEQALGIHLAGYYASHFFQGNIGQQLIYHRKSLGERRRFWETSTALTAFILGGTQALKPDFQIGKYQHQRTFQRGLGFSYLWYYDQAGTSQRSGAWIYNEGYVSVVLENDIFGGQGKDRFRTGTLTLSYRNDWWKLQGQLALWTGETRGSTWFKTPGRKMPNGYRDLSQLPFGSTSHGIFSVGFIAQPHPFGSQVSSLRVGIDSEEIRHIFQNRLMHDLIWLPKRYPRTTPHYPRLNEAGQPVFRAAERRPDRLYIQIGNE